MNGTIPEAGMQPRPAERVLPTGRRRGIHAAAFTCAMLAATQAGALTFSPTVTNAGTLVTGPLQLGYYNFLEVNLNPGISTYSFYSGHYAARCDGLALGSRTYCVTQVVSTDVSSLTKLIAARSEGYDFDAFVQDQNKLMLGYGSAVPGTFVIDFTETFTETRAASPYAVTGADPSGDGARTDLTATSTIIPAPFSSPTLDCTFSGGVNYLTTVAACSLKLTFAAPAVPPIPPAAAVPEPSSWGMLLGGFALVGTARRRRRHAAPTPGASL